MRQEAFELVVPDAAGPGTPVIIDRHSGTTVMIVAADLNGGTLNLMGSLNGTDFDQIGATIAAAELNIDAADLALFSIRIDRATGTSVGRVVDVRAFDQRTQ